MISLIIKILRYAEKEFLNILLMHNLFLFKQFESQNIINNSHLKKFSYLSHPKLLHNTKTILKRLCGVTFCDNISCSLQADNKNCKLFSDFFFPSVGGVYLCLKKCINYARENDFFIQIFWMWCYQNISVRRKKIMGDQTCKFLLRIIKGDLMITQYN